MVTAFKGCRSCTIVSLFLAGIHVQNHFEQYDGWHGSYIYSYIDFELDEFNFLPECWWDWYVLLLPKYVGYKGYLVGAKITLLESSSFLINKGDGSLIFDKYMKE